MPGATILVAGQDCLLVWNEGASRVTTLAGQSISCGGPLASFPGRIERFLKQLALQTLSAETAEYAELAGASVRSVSVGDPDTRWGSCSADGRIRYSWRLILAPSQARRFVVAHEVAHLRHMNHGKRFWALATLHALRDAAQILAVSPAALRKQLERRAGRVADGAVEANIDGVRGRKFANRWRVSFGQAWTK